MKTRSIWTGLLKISLITIPVKLYTALNEADKISFNQLHKGCHQRLRQQLHCPVHGKVEREDVVKGYEIEKDRFVVVDPAELEALQIESTRCIEIAQFVDAKEINPLILDTPYYLGPGGPVAEQGFSIFRETLRRKNRIGIGRVVLFGKERVVALRPLGGGFVLITLRYPAEVRSATPIFEGIGKCGTDASHLALAETLVESQTAKFDASIFTDRYQEAVLQLIKDRLNGSQAVQVSQKAELGQALNFLEALQKSIGQSAGAAHRKPSSRNGKPVRVAAA
ncbi:MAG: Ku protein [Verrucomicrobiales bacterium]|nr:Ku protein [Verrucomicrobiales bacterium]